MLVLVLWVPIVQVYVVAGVCLPRLLRLGVELASDGLNGARPQEPWQGHDTPVDELGLYGGHKLAVGGALLVRVVNRVLGSVNNVCYIQHSALSKVQPYNSLTSWKL